MWLPKIWILGLLVRSSNAHAPTLDDHRIYDVCVVGGGASGTYAAVRLQQMGYSVVLIEKESRLGGHVNTFYDPASGVPVDFGVAVYEGIPVVAQFFASLNVTLAKLIGNPAPANPVYANFKADGKAIPDPASSWYNQTAIGLAIGEYVRIISQYPFLSNGYNLPSPVPEDLLLPWGDFVDKYSLGNLAFTVHIYVQCNGNILAQPAIYVMKDFSLDLAQAFLGSGPAFVKPASNANQEIYNQALKQLGHNVFLESTPNVIRRYPNKVEVDIHSHKSGRKTTTQAKKLLVAIEPTLSNIQGLGMDLSNHEQSLIAEFNNSYYFNAVLRVPGLPPGTSFTNVDPDAPHGIPALPAVYTFNSAPGTTDLLTAYFGSPFYLSDEEVKKAILDELSNIIYANGYNVTKKPELLAFTNHSPFKLTVSTTAVRDGFYDKVNALQGGSNTWWTGAAWQAHDSSQIWNWTESMLLPRIVASL